MVHVLIVQPDPAACSALSQTLGRQGYEVTELLAAPPSERGLRPADTDRPTCILAAASPGESYLRGLPDHLLGAPVILLADRPELRQAVAAMRAGASNYLAYPCDESELVAAIEQAVADVIRHGDQQRAESRHTIIGQSPAIQALRSKIERVGPTDATVIIRGESGTGKELIARSIHASSQRAHAPLVTMNCASLPPQLIESELFGFATEEDNGARTRAGLLEAANGGTLFLDEIGELKPETQARLLRVLEAGELRRLGGSQTLRVDVRLITSTQRDLGRLVASGQFREDLFYRLNVVAIDIPPLRQRGDDILLLADRILQHMSERLGRQPGQFAPEARQAMLRYHWPGNVRELENAIERAVILCDRAIIPAELLALELGRSPQRETTGGIGDQTSLEDYFVSFVLANQDQMTETELAEKLGISRKSLWERRQRLNIPRKRSGQRRPRRDEG